MSAPIVHLVGAGPGDPDLITVRGLRAIQAADAIVHDRLGTAELLAFASADCVLIDAGKAPDRHGMTQDEINEALIGQARLGRNVVRLKGGDPFVFGRGGEEALALLEAGIPFTIVPGVSSALAAPASAGIPITHRGLARTVTIASGHDDPHSPAACARWQAMATVPGTLVLLMSMGRLGEIADALIAGGRAADEPAAAIQWATTSRERRVSATLDTLAERCRDAELGNPAVVVIGPVVALGALIESGAVPIERDGAADEGEENAPAGVQEDEVRRRSHS